MPIRRRLTLSFSGATLLLVVVFGVLFLDSFATGLDASLDRVLRNEAAAVAQRGGDTIPRRGDDTIAQVLDASGTVISTTAEAGSSPLVDASTAGRAARTPQFSDARIGDDGEMFRLLARRASQADDRLVVVATSREATDEAIDRVRTALFVGGGLAVLAAAAGAWAIATAALRPVERMRRSAADISAHDSAARLEIPSTRDEIAALATTMNDLLARLHSALDRQRAFVADAGHELRTPLAVLRMELELADRPSRSLAELRVSLRHAAQETARVQRIAESLLFLASHDDARAVAMREPTEIRDVVERAASSAAAAARARGVTIECTTDADDAPLVASVDADLLRRALDNLLDNALRYAPAGSRVEVHAAQVHDRLQVSVRDEGPGFPPEFLPSAFERFRRADEARTRHDGGTGLGLAIVDAVAGAHGGRAFAVNGHPGAVVTIDLPDADRDVNTHTHLTRPLQA